MSDLDHDDDFSKAFNGLGEEKPPETPPADPTKDETKPTDPPAEPPKQDPKPEDPKPEDPKKDEEVKSEPPKEEPKEDPSKDGKTDSPAGDETKEKEGAKPGTPTDTPPEKKDAETPEKPLTKEDVTSIFNNIRTEERTSAKEVENTTQEVIDAYYPDGLSSTLVDQKSGKELKTPQDVIDASGGEMSAEEATQWLMNEQYKLDQDVKRIKGEAQKVAETTINFKRDATTALKKYEPLFKEYPHLQKKVYDKLMKQVKADEKKGVILSAPDVMEHYDDYLEPYQQAFEYGKGQPATNPTTPSGEQPAKPSADDRLDEPGDAGATPPNDPNDFAQQVNKELAKGL